MSFDVEGQRTSKLLMLRRAFAFDRRGGSKKNLVVMSESINRIHGVDLTERAGPLFRERRHSILIYLRKPEKLRLPP